MSALHHDIPHSHRQRARLDKASEIRRQHHFGSRAPGITLNSEHV